MNADATGPATTPAHEVTAGELTPPERGRLEARAGPRMGLLALVCAPAAVFAVVIQRVLMDGLGADWPTALFASLALVLPAALWFVAKVVRAISADVARVRADLEGGVEELHVHASRAVTVVAEHSSVDPAVGIDIGEGRLLLLVGQWLRDGATYGCPVEEREAAAESDEIQDDFLNGLPPPWAFPSRAFTLRRLRSGEVLSIRVSGAYLRPERDEEGLDLTRFRRADSQILSGSLDQLVSVCRTHLPRWDRAAGA